MNGRFVLYAADPSGSSWDVMGFDTLAEANEAHEIAHRARSDRYHGVYDSENPERGDIQGQEE